MTLAPGRWSIRARLTLWYTSILLIILLVIGALSYSILWWSLRRDLDASLSMVAEVIRDVGAGQPEAAKGPGVEALLRQILGPQFYEEFFQLRSPEGTPNLRSRHLQERALPLSPVARANAMRGRRTYETLTGPNQDRVRLLTMPVVTDGRVTQVVQVGIPLHRTEQTLSRYLETLIGLIPVGVGLAAVGGAAIARRALRPVGLMSRTARRITGEDLSRRLPSGGTGDELDYLAETLNAMLERLQGAFTQMRQVAAVAAHELRTPLTILKGSMEVVLRGERSAPEYRRVLASSLEEVERLIRLAEDLLFFSRLTVGLDLARGPVPLEPLVLEAAEVGASLAKATGVSVRVGALTPLAACGDAEALRRAIMNLVENGVKYTPAEGVVELSLARMDGHAVVVVRDTGIGFDPSDAERIFEPFVRLDAARSHDPSGTGLGLPIARSIVQAQGGTLSAESAPGVGSRFTIRLPLA